MPDLSPAIPLASNVPEVGIVPSVEEVADEEIVLPEELKDPPAWMQRALDPETPTTEAYETVRTMTAPLDPDKRLGQWILFPSIRLIDNRLMGADSEAEAREWSMDKGDYLIFKNKDSAEFFSHRLSDLIGQTRNKHVKQVRMMSDPEFQNYKELRGG
jgi:hypothetical protein